MQGQDEVEDGLRLRRHLSQLDALASKRSSIVVSVRGHEDWEGSISCHERVDSLGYVVSISLLLVRQSIEVFSDLEPHDTWRGVRQVALQVLGVHGNVSSAWKRQAGQGRRGGCFNGGRRDKEVVV